jgi:hypothetical protein
MRTKLAISLLGLLLTASPLAAQEPGEGEEFDLREAIKKVTELLEETEALIVKSMSTKGESPEEAQERGEKTTEAIDDLLRRGRDNGEEVVDTITKILENAPPGNSPDSDQEQQEPNPDDDEKRRREENRPSDRDPQNSADGDPKGKERDEKPRTKKGKAQRPDPEKEWLASLPEQVRLLYLNKEWEKIPPRWRSLIQAYMDRLAEAESSGSGD